MKLNENSAAIFSALSGILGIVIGIGLTNYYDGKSQERRQTIQSSMDSMVFTAGNVPVEMIPLQQLVIELKGLTQHPTSAIAAFAALAKEYPACSEALSPECRPFMVKTVNVYREAMGYDAAAEEDIDAILRPKYERATEAMKRLTTR